MFVRIKSHMKKIFQDNFVAFVHLRVRECSCAPILRFFSAASDGATAQRRIQNVFLVNFAATVLRYLHNN